MHIFRKLTTVPYAQKTSSGFTLLESLIVISLLGLLAFSALGALRSSRAKADLYDGQATVLRAFELARSRAATGAGTNDHGVHIASDKVIVFEGLTYTGSGSELFLAPTVSADNAGTDVVFKRLTAQANPSITITLTHTSGNAKTVQVTALGAITPN